MIRLKTRLSDRVGLSRRSEQRGVMLDADPTGRPALTWPVYEPWPALRMRHPHRPHRMRRLSRSTWQVIERRRQALERLREARLKRVGLVLRSAFRPTQGVS